MTAQEVFDTVKKHLLAQNAKSLNELGCVYRGLGGLKCAVGCLIDDNEYFPVMETKTVFTLKLDGLLPGRLHEHGRLLGLLQNVHDNNEPEEWAKQLDVVAHISGLTP